MTLRTSPWPAGVPCWVDLSVPDVAAASAFYGEVFGWTFASPGDDFGGYVIGGIDGAAAAGIAPLQPGWSTSWTLYIASEDVDKTAAGVAESGGSVVADPFDVGPLGRMLLATDPTGAVFGVWQAGTHIGASITSQPGGLAWEDLRTPDPDAARAFYCDVFGYRTEAMPMAGPDYTMFLLADDEGPLGGMGGMMGDDEAPPHWLVYFGVADAAVAVATAERLGATITSPVFDTPYGRMAGIVDPFGARFHVVETDGSTAPER